MVSLNLRETVRQYAEEYGVKAVWLFGSALDDEEHAGDIDLAVEGLAPEKFFEFYGHIYFALSKPVDLVDLGQNPPIASIIREKGVCIYDR